MKKTYRVNNLDCAHCADKIQRSIAKIDGVQSVTLNFMTQKLTLEASDERFGEVEQAALAAARKVEPDCTIVG